MKCPKCHQNHTLVFRCVGQRGGLAGKGKHHPDPARMRAAVIARIEKHGQRKVLTADYIVKNGIAVKARRGG